MATQVPEVPYFPPNREYLDALRLRKKDSVALNDGTAVPKDLLADWKRHLMEDKQEFGDLFKVHQLIFVRKTCV